MRTIPEVAEDIKSILNNIECTQECNGETLVDIDELVNEILTINCYKDKPQTNADRIRNMSDEELAEFLRQTVWEEGANLFDCQDFRCEHPCEECKAYLSWLQSEVKGSE